MRPSACGDGRAEPAPAPNVAAVLIVTGLVAGTTAGHIANIVAAQEPRFALAQGARRLATTALSTLLWLAGACDGGAVGSDRGSDRAHPHDDAGQGQAGTAEPAPGPAASAPVDAAVNTEDEAGSTRFPACTRGLGNAVTDLFCGETPPHIEGLVDLQEQLGLVVDPVAGGRTLSVLLAHSTALSGHHVSSINPRAILMARIGTAVAFQRGVQQVEIAAVEHTDRSLAFYLVTFEQACNQRPEGCLPGELYTPQVERDWQNVTLFDDEDLKNTPEDCRQCHQRARDEPVLLMRELQAPWTHYFGPGGVRDGPAAPFEAGDLVADYRAAWGDTAYGGLPSSVIGTTFGFLLEASVPREQPLVFDAPAIFDERWPLHPEAGYPNEPQPSPTWDRAYEAFKRGEHLPLPYFGERATDPDKLAALTEAYAAFRRGERALEELPDLADIFPDDPRTRAQIGLQTEPDASPVDALIQACGPCHNDVLDQDISRARFNIELARMPADERALAIERIGRGPDQPGVMPPPEARALDAHARTALIEYLARDERPNADDLRLQRAARLGMAGNALP